MQSADAEIAVQTASDTLKEFLIGGPGSGEEPFAVFAHTADEAIAGNQRAQRARVDVSAWDIFRAPALKKPKMPTPT